MQGLLSKSLLCFWPKETIRKERDVYCVYFSISSCQGLRLWGSQYLLGICRSHGTKFMSSYLSWILPLGHLLMAWEFLRAGLSGMGSIEVWTVDLSLIENDLKPSHLLGFLSRQSQTEPSILCDLSACNSTRIWAQDLILVREEFKSSSCLSRLCWLAFIACKF